MSQPLTAPGDTRIKRTGQRILYALWDADGRALTTSELAAQLGVEDNGSVHYQIKEKLGPEAEDFVRKAGETPTRGPVPATVWMLTPDGVEWVEDNMSVIAPPQTLDELLERHRSLENTVESNKQRIHEIQGKWAWAEQHREEIEEGLEEVKTLTSRLSNDVEQYQEEMKQRQEDLEALVNAIKEETEKYLQHYENRITELEAASSNSSDER